jgi:hypothetical protein
MLVKKMVIVIVDFFQGLSHLTSLPWLEELYVSGCDFVSDVGVRYIAQITSLTKLFASLCPLITDDGKRCDFIILTFFRIRSVNYFD